MFKTTSPYINLLFSSSVKWLPFENQTLQIAKEEDKPIFIHIGQTGNYVDRQEVQSLFLDKRISKILNDNFISIAIDAEDYPEAYLFGWDILQILNVEKKKQANIFLMPDFTPITSTSSSFPEDLLLLSQNLISAFNQKRETLTGMAQEAAYLLEKSGVVSETKFNKSFISFKMLQEYTDDWSYKMVSFENYFKKRRPFSIKIPSFYFLIDYIKITPQPVINDFILKTCDVITQSAMQDKSDGGFYYQMEDYKCETPLYEKKLSENLLISLLLCKAYNHYGKSGYKKSAVKAISFIEEKLRDSKGGYFSSLSTDKDNKNEVKDIRKITSYNALYISTLCNIYMILGDKKYLSLAIENYHYMNKCFHSENNIIPRYIIDDENSSIEGTLLDYAEFIRANLSLYEILKDNSYLEQATKIMNYTIGNFYNQENGMFFKTSKYSFLIPIKRESNIDGSMASANSVICHDLLKLHEFTGSDKYLNMATKQLFNVSANFPETGPYMGNWASQVLYYLKLSDKQ